VDQRVAKLLRAQAAYYGLTGLWPLVGIRSFEALTGPKASPWLAKTVGSLVGVIAGALALATREDRLRPDTILLSMGSAAALGAIDVRYALAGRISKVYLLDAAAQAAVLVAWLPLLADD
jgi:hypothetical protein